jgi:hypothetical protein
MRTPASCLFESWPAAPHTAEAWQALPEISLGRHLVADVGWVSSGRERAVAAGVSELPLPRGQIDDGFVALPAVTVVAENGSPQMFRLPVSYAAAVRTFVMVNERDRREPEFTGGRATHLPCHFVIGDREAVFFLPSDAVERPVLLN